MLQHISSNCPKGRLSQLEGGEHQEERSWSKPGIWGLNLAQSLSFGGCCSNETPLRRQIAVADSFQWPQRLIETTYRWWKKTKTGRGRAGAKLVAESSICPKFGGLKSADAMIRCSRGKSLYQLSSHEPKEQNQAGKGHQEGRAELEQIRRLGYQFASSWEVCRVLQQ